VDIYEKRKQTVNISFYFERSQFLMCAHVDNYCGQLVESGGKLWK